MSCDLSSLASGATVEQVAREVGYESPEAAAVALGAGGAVLVLDSCEHVLDSAAALAARVVDAGGGRLVATSRRAARRGR